MKLISKLKRNKNKNYKTFYKSFDLMLAQINYAASHYMVGWLKV